MTEWKAVLKVKGASGNLVDATTPDNIIADDLSELFQMLSECKIPWQDKVQKIVIEKVEDAASGE